MRPFEIKKSSSTSPMMEFSPRLRMAGAREGQFAA
jgi:hypothetical protein